MLEQEIVESFSGAIKKLRTFKGTNSYAELAGDPSTFKVALFSDAGFCGLWEIESGPWILGLGNYQPTLIPTLVGCASSKSVRATIPRTWTAVELEKRSEWNFYLIESTTTPKDPLKHAIEELGSDSEINAFIEEYAPDSSTKAGDPEILFWHGIRGQEGELLSIGGAVRWKNGSTMVVSIATAPSARGKSMAQEVTSSLVKRLFDLGEPIVGLGVWAHNAPAIRAYENVGFHLEEEFVSGSLLQA